MKYSIFFFLICCYSSAFSQDIQPYNPGGLEGFSRKFQDQVSQPKLLVPQPKILAPTKNREQQKGDMPVVKMENKAMLSGKTIDGSDIYTMLIDNMPCLVPQPEFTAKMPVAGKSAKENFLQVVPQD